MRLDQNGQYYPSASAAAPSFGAINPMISSSTCDTRIVRPAAVMKVSLRNRVGVAERLDKSQAAMLAEALNLLFERYGEPPIAKA